VTPKNTGMIPYNPNYLMYSRPPDGWHDEPFEYCFTFAQFFTGIVISTPRQFDFLNSPMQFDPDADFFMRGIAVLVDNVPTGKTSFRLDFNMRIRNAYGRALDSASIPMMSYATSPETLANAAFGPEPGSPVATPWFPELYCPSNGVMTADFQCQTCPTGVTPVDASYSFHLYFQGIKRFRNEECKPGNTESTKVGQAA
jgi:hypothetical protein